MLMNGFVRKFISLTGTTTRRYYPAAAAEAQTGIPLDESTASSSAPNEKNRKVSAHIDALVEQIVNLPLLDVSDLNYALKKRLNIPDTPFMPAGFAFPTAGVAAPASPAAEEQVTQKISFAVKLTKFDDTKKIALIKQIRDLIPGINLVQAKKFVEGAPTEVKTNLGKTEAEELKTTLEKVGGVCEIV